MTRSCERFSNGLAGANPGELDTELLRLSIGKPERTKTPLLLRDPSQLVYPLRAKLVDILVSI